MDDDGSGALLAEQVAYYRAMAPEYLRDLMVSSTVGPFYWASTHHGRLAA